MNHWFKKKYGILYSLKYKHSEINLHNIYLFKEMCQWIAGLNEICEKR